MPTENNNPAARRPAGPKRPPAPRGRRNDPPRPDFRPAAERREALPRGSRWLTAIIMVGATLIVCLLLALFILQSASDLFGLNKPDRQIEVNVPENSTVTSISALMFEKGIITQPFTFRMYADIKLDGEDKIFPGSYIMNSNFAYDQIIDWITTGDTTKEEVSITFIEGGTLYETAQKLEEAGVCGIDEFLDYMQGGDIDYEFMNQVPRDPFRYHRLEGYAFPDTYLFYKDMDVALVAEKFLDNLELKLDDDIRSKAMNRNLSIDELLTFASIVQKEAGNPVEMLTVASVFQNRLDARDTFPRLESDVTRDYVDNFIKPFLDLTDQPMYDSYNTYVREGLPVGPICNPGMDAINAVLEPDSTDFYFFVTDDEGTYYYGRTLQQHEQNVYTAESVGGTDVHGTATARE
jgi:UPF0755 protein